MAVLPVCFSCSRSSYVRLLTYRFIELILILSCISFLSVVRRSGLELANLLSCASFLGSDIIVLHLECGDFDVHMSWKPSLVLDFCGGCGNDLDMAQWFDFVAKNLTEVLSLWV